jgi:hypothetical protein
MDDLPDVSVDEGHRPLGGRSPSDSSWRKYFVIEAEQDGDRAMLVLTVSLGSPPPEEEAATHSLLLQTNALWRDTGAIRMGLDGPDGEVVLMSDVPLKGLDVDGLGLRLHRFTDAALGWREVIAQTADGSEADPKALEGMLKI